VTTADFKAIVVNENADKTFNRLITRKSFEDLPEGDVLVKVRYSSLNYKDALSATGNRGVSKNFPHTPGIDAAGSVTESRSPHFKSGELFCNGPRDPAESQKSYRTSFESFQRCQLIVIIAAGADIRVGKRDLSNQAEN